MRNKRKTREIIIESNAAAAPPNSRWAAWRSLGVWLNLICLLGTLGIAVWAVQEARWIKPAPSLILILILSILAGTILAKSHIPAVIAHPLSLLVGLGILFWQGLLLFPEPDLLSRAALLIENLQAWWYAQTMDIPSPVTTHIALMFGYLAWIMGYFSAWFLMRKHIPWIAVFLGTVVILANLNFWVSGKYYYFLYFLIAALIFIFIATFTRHSSQVAQNIKSGQSRVLWVTASLCLVTGAVFFTWNSAGFKVDPIASYTRAHSPFTKNVQTYWQNFFAPVPGSGAPRAIFEGPQVTQFGGSLELSSQIIFTIDTESQNYWKTQIYDYYNSSGWKTSNTSDKTLEDGTPAGAASTPASGQLDYILIPMVNTNLLPTTGDLVSGDIPIIEKTLTPQTFVIRLQDTSGDALLPADIASTAKSIRASRSTRRRFESQIESLLPTYLKLISINQSGSTIDSITVVRNQAEEKTVVALSSAKMMVPQQKVTFTVQTPPTFPANKLAAAGTNYPIQVADRYLQLPSTLPERVKELAISTTKEAVTPYQKAVAIRNYLIKLPYSLIIDSPPPDADGVDYFLFTQKSGYCTYFASAMTVMLRSVGVPARLVTGFLPVEYDASAYKVIIRERDFHAWTEVYFPGCGWIPFDSTPPSNSSLIPPNPETSTQPLPEIPVMDPAGQGTSQNASFKLTDYIARIAGGAVGLMLLVLFIGWLWINSRPRNSSVLYSRMVFLASLAGLGPKPWQTALEFSRQLSLNLPQYSPEIDGIVQVYVDSCYGSGSLSSRAGEEINRSWRKLSRALLRRLLHIRKI